MDQFNGGGSGGGTGKSSNHAVSKSEKQRPVPPSGIRVPPPSIYKRGQSRPFIQIHPLPYDYEEKGGTTEMVQEEAGEVDERLLHDDDDDDDGSDRKTDPPLYCGKMSCGRLCADYAALLFFFFLMTLGVEWAVKM